MISNIIEFFKLAVLFGDISKMAIPATEEMGKRSLSPSSVNFTEAGIEISISRQKALLFFNAIAPYQELKDNGGLKHRAMLSMPILMTGEEESSFFPLVSIEMEEYRTNILNQVKTAGFAKVLVPYSTKLSLNEILIGSGFFTTKIEFSEDLKNGKKYDVTLSDLIPESYRTDTVKSLKEIMSYFTPKKVSGFKIKVPSLDENSIAFTMFGMEQDFKTNRLLDEVMTNPSPAVERFLLGDDKKIEILKETPMLGHFTIRFPASSGQYEAHSRVVAQIMGHSTELIEPQFGPAGTGKTSLIHHMQKSIETRIAMILMNDINAELKSSVVTSSANKAISGLLTPFNRSKMEGVIYMSGSKKRKVDSKKDNDLLMKELLENEYNHGYALDLISDIQTTWKRMQKRQNVFDIIKSSSLFIKDTDNCKKDLENQLEKLKDNDINHEEQAELNKSLYAIKRIANVQETDVEEFILANKDEINFIADKVKKQGFFDKVFKQYEIEFKEGHKVDENDEIKLLAEVVNSFNLSTFKASLQTRKNENKKDVLKKIIKIISSEEIEQDIVNMIMSPNWDQYSRIHLFQMTNEMSFKARNYNRQIAYKKKEEILRAIKYFSVDNQFEYIKAEYPSTKDQLKFLSNVAIVYPFIGSTLASVQETFPGLNKNIRPFDYTIADEAGMITIVDMLKPLQLSDRAIVVGDPYQLQPIFSLNKIFEDALKNMVEPKFWEKYGPTVVSAFHRATGVNNIHSGIGKAVLLNEHRRCHPAIADLFKGLVEAYGNLKVKTELPKGNDLIHFNKVGSPYMFLNTVNKGSKGKNTNEAEIEKTKAVLVRLKAAGYDLTKDVGIITPYKGQTELLIKNFKNDLNHSSSDMKIGTVHSFQGAEFKVIIFCSVVSDDHENLRFINDGPYMMNVAISRAKFHFIMIGNFAKLTSDKSDSNFIGRIAKKIKEAGKLYM